MDSPISRLRSIFIDGRPIIPFLTAGFPKPTVFLDAVTACVDAGAAALEIGVPFSDPLADGPTIQHSSQIALEQGTDLDSVFELTHRVCSRHQIPVLLMGYFNPLLKRGLDRFASEVRSAGACGTIIPDCPVDEAGDWIASSRRAGLANVFLIAPTTTDERITVIDRHSTAFSYCVSVAGVTGARSGVAASTRRFLKRVTKLAEKPHVVGFGISDPAHIRELRELADGFVVGSALVSTLGGGKGKERIHRLSRLVGSLVRAAE